MASYSLRFLLVFFLLGPVSVWSQERVLSEDEFKNITDAAAKLSYVASYRTRMWSQHFEKGASTPSMSISEISESQSNDRRRNLRITTEGQATKKVETIKIDNVSFERIEDGPWTRRENAIPAGGGSGTFNRFIELPVKRKEFTFRFLGRDLVNSVDAGLYESRKFFEYDTSSYHHAYTVIERFWVQADGKLLKSETETIEADGWLSYRMGVIYEYPKNLVIVAPVK